MILNALVQIGENLKEKEVNFDLDEEIVRYINLKYNKPPSIPKIIKIIIKPQIIDYLESIKRKLTEIKFTGIESGKIDKIKRKSIENQIIEQIKPEIEILREGLDTELHEYRKEHDYQMLRGNKTGAAVFFSPTFYEKITGKTGITSLPLWKVKLDLTSHLIPEENSQNFLSRFFEVLPNLKEFNNIDVDDTQSVFKFVISRIFTEAINSHLITKYSLKTGIYYISLCFNNKWPSEFETFRSYYKSNISSGGLGSMGICEGCAKEKSISNGLTGELGFYTIDQKGFTYPFLTNESYQLCEECKINAEKGLNYVKEHQRLYLGSRGKNKSPYQMYVIPIAEDSTNIEKILPKVDLLRSSLNQDENLHRIETTSVIIQEIQEENASEPDEVLTKKDLLDSFLEYSEDDSKADRIRFSLLLVAFYHPEGQSKAFHNIISIDFLEYENIIKLGKNLAKIRLEHNEMLSLRDIYYIFGEHKFRKYISNLFNLKRMNLRLLCKEANMNCKKEFTKLMVKPQTASSYVGLNLKRANTYIRLARSLELV